MQLFTWRGQARSAVSVLTILLTAALTLRLTPAAAAGGVVRINDVVVSQPVLEAYAQRFGTRIPPGNYWYDQISGAWGIMGGPTLGCTLPGLSLGGPLKAQASHGDTGVFINGRQLHRLDVAGLQQLGVSVQRGRWWVLANGSFGQEGSPMVLGNLLAYSRAASGTQYESVYSSVAGGSVTSFGDRTFGASFRNSDGSYSSYHSGQ
jgi:hypothetical protein